MFGNSIINNTHNQQQANSSWNDLTLAPATPARPSSVWVSSALNSYATCSLVNEKHSSINFRIPCELDSTSPRISRLWSGTGGPTHLIKLCILFSVYQVYTRLELDPVGIFRKSCYPHSSSVTGWLAYKVLIEMIRVSFHPCFRINVPQVSKLYKWTAFSERGVTARSQQ